MSAQAGWYPDPGGGQDLYRYWDGRSWSAATSPNPSAPAPVPLVPGAPAGASTGRPLGAQPYPTSGGRSAPYLGSGSAAYGGGSAYVSYQQAQKKRSPVGWWLAGAALLVVIIVVAVVAIRSVAGGTDPVGVPGSPGSQSACPPPKAQSTPPSAAPADGRVHGGPVSFPELGSPWSGPQDDTRVPFGSDVHVQQVSVETNYDGANDSWVASVLVAELQAGDGFFSPEQGSKVVVKCILGAFYGNNPVTSDVKVDKAATIDGHEAWVVESQLSFDIKGLQTKGELLIVAIVAAGATSGLYYASIPDTTPELVQPARDTLKALTVEG